MPEYISVDLERAEPTCGDQTCEQLEHWARVYIGPDLLNPMYAMEQALAAMLSGCADTKTKRKARIALARASKTLRAVDGVAL